MSLSHEGESQHLDHGKYKNVVLIENRSGSRLVSPLVLVSLKFATYNVLVQQS